MKGLASSKCLMPRNKAEKELQKVLDMHLRTMAFQTGLRPNKLVLLKEPEILDGTKTDFLVHYGLMRPVVIEIKLSAHGDISVQSDLSKKKSYASYQGYLRKYNAAGGIFVGLDNLERKRGTETWASQLARIRSAYEDGSSFVSGIEQTSK